MAEILVTFAHTFNLNAANFLAFNGITSSATKGFVAPFAGQVARISINRADVDPALINIVVNGAVQHSIASSATAVTETLITPVNFDIGDVISVENDVTSSQVTDISVNLFIQDSIAIPAPLSVRDLYRMAVLNAIYSGLISAHGSKTVLGAGNAERETPNRVKQIDAIVDVFMETRP